MSQKETVRVQMELPQLSIKRLKKLKERTEAASYAEVTKNAYRLYDKLIEIQDDNKSSLMIKGADGKLSELFLI